MPNSQIQSPPVDAASDKKIQDALTWLADAPSFIDPTKVGAIYDAVVSPESSEESVKVTIKTNSERTIGADASGEIKVGFAEWLKTVFPFLNADVTGKLGGKMETKHGDENTKEITLKRIDNPQRQLVQLALHYVANQPDRIRCVDGTGIADLAAKSVDGSTPKPLIFLDLPGKAQANAEGLPQTRFVPMAAEFANGSVRLMFKQYMLEVVGLKPEFLDWEDDWDGKTFEAHKDEYWAKFAGEFKASAPMVMIEEASEQMGRIRWINYQLLADNAGKVIHINCCPNELANTGTFAHRMIQRSNWYGLRLVGTLCSGPSLNVLAIFDK